MFGDHDRLDFIRCIQLTEQFWREHLIYIAVRLTSKTLKYSKVYNTILVTIDLHIRKVIDLYLRKVIDLYLRKVIDLHLRKVIYLHLRKKIDLYLR